MGAALQKTGKDDLKKAMKALEEALKVYPGRTK